MRLLITGIGGFAGRHLSARAIADGHDVLGLVRPGSHADVRGASVWRADVTDAGAVSEVLADAGPEVVVHLAGHSSVGRSFGEPLATWKVNVEGTLAVLEAIRSTAPSARCVVVTSGEIYGRVPLAELPVTPDTPLRPVSPYGASKAATDLAALQYRVAYGLDIVRVRAFNHIGPGQDARFVLPNVARQVARAERDGMEQVSVTVGNVETRRDFTDVRDIVDAYLRIAEHGDPDVTYLACTGRSVAVRDLVEGVASLARIDAAVVSDPDLRREGEQPDLYGWPGPLNDRLGWRPRIGLQQTLADTLDWWRGVVEREN